MIGFYTKDTDFTLKSGIILKKWIRRVVEDHGKKCGDINIIFCSDSYLLEINRQFLGHDYFTDIITFDYCRGNKIHGELYISIETVEANAVEYEQAVLTELHRVIIHGILHLLGFDDHKKEDIYRMRDAEDKSLILLESYW